MSNWREEAIELANSGLSWRKISKRVDVPKSTVSDFLRGVFKANDQCGTPTRIGPKILLWDIETAPVLGYVWSLWKQNVGLNQIKADWYMLSWSAKWLGSDEVMYDDLRDDKNDDTRILSTLWKLLDEADWVITHNGDSFDLPKVRARMVLQGLEPFSPCKSIDTCKAAKKAFNFTSNKLEYLSKMLAPEHAKSSHAKFAGFELWTQCLAGNIEAWDEMRDYNIQDVDALEAVYLKLRPWIPNHPNFALYVEDTVEICNCCGSKDLYNTGKKVYTNLSSFELMRCYDCKTYKRRRVNTLPKDKMKTLLMNPLG